MTARPLSVRDLAIDLKRRSGALNPPIQSRRVTLTLRPGSLDEVVRWRALRQPQRSVCVFLTDGETAEAGLTYAELDRRARAIGAVLQEQGLQGERVLLLFAPGLHFITAFVGCLYAGTIPVPAYPPHPSRLERALPLLDAIAGDAHPLGILTTASIRNSAAPILARRPSFERVRWLAADELDDAAGTSWQPVEGRSGDQVAFLQYTSGSTAAPRGVMVTHANLLNNLFLIQHAFEHTADSQGVIWLPPYHDMGLIGGILQPIFAGFPVTLMSPFSFLQRPIRWLRAIARYRGTTSGGPNFAYDLCVRKIPAEQRAELDLSSWKVAFTGAEPVRARTLSAFAGAYRPARFNPAAFYPCYGLAESTLIAAGGLRGAGPVFHRVSAPSPEEANVTVTAQADVHTFVGCGQAMPNHEIGIVSPQTLKVVEPGEVGEIWVSGPSVARGYWNRPADTENTFGARLEGSDRTFLRTGDLGFIRGGELFVTGRLKDLIILSGRNHYPHDLELTVEGSHPLLRPGCSAAITIDVDGEERLVVLAEVEPRRREVALRRREDGTGAAPASRGPLDAIVGAIRRAVVEIHDVLVDHIVLLPAGEIPKTSSGKIRRHACRSGYLGGLYKPWEPEAAEPRRNHAARSGSRDPSISNGRAQECE